MASLSTGSYNNIWTKTDDAGKKKWSTADKTKATANKILRKDRVGKRSKPLASFQPSTKASKKKSYGGDKVRWGKPGDEMDYTTVLDKGDPNYDSQEEEHGGFYVGSGDLGTHGYGRDKTKKLSSSPARASYLKERNLFSENASELTLPEFKKIIIPVLREYYVSQDMEEVERHLFETSAPQYHYEFLKRTITMAMDLKDRGKEAASRLLSFLYGNQVLTTDQIGKGFERLFEVSDDLLIDVPNAERILAAFVARAVVDEILTPKFLVDKDVMKLGGDIITQARVLLSVKHASARISTGWGPGDGRLSDELKKEIKMLLSEYFTASDVVETGKSILALDAKWFYHEVVKRAVIFSMSKTKYEQNLISKLFKYLSDMGAISEDQFIIGFARIFDELEDICLDTPEAGDIFQAFVFQGMEDQYLPGHFMLMVAASSGDGEQIRRMHQEFQ
eukprot:g4212.t1